VVLLADGRRIVLRDVVREDHDLLLALYASTRVVELDAVPWPDETKAAFIAQQFHAQDTDYRARHPDGSFQVIEVAQGRVAEVGGRVITSWLAPTHLRLVDIIVAVEWRSVGIGTAVLTHLCHRADNARAVVSLHVEHGNPAAELYRRLGFVDVQRGDFHVLMERPVS
jgi:ribosomal protein S18 acetylase RimI-like enzyme